MKLIIFDMDGTLINSSLTIANAINYVRKNLGFEPLSNEFILKHINDHKINPAKTFYHTQTFSKDHEKWFSEYYSKNHDKELILYDGVKELLEELKEKKYKLAIATNAYRVSTLESLKHLNIYDFFSSIACFDDVKSGKPNPDMLLKILDDLSCKKENTIFVGDSSRDKIASQRADIDFVMVDWGFSDHFDAVKSIEELKKILIS